MRRILALLPLLALWTLAAAATEPPRDPADIAPLLPGESLPAGVFVRDAENTELDLSEYLAVGRKLVIFYRGGWCPYCSRHLKDLADVEAELIELGYDILAISPDRPGRIAEYAAQVGETFHATLLSDSAMTAASAFGLAFRVPDETVEKYLGWNIDLEKDSGHDHHLLPVPAAYLFVDGVIQFQYANPNYKVRVAGELLTTAARLAATSSED